MLQWLILSALCVGVSGAPSQTTWRVGQEVQTASGKVTGHASKWQPEVSEYLGIVFRIFQDRSLQADIARRHSIRPAAVR
jgi:hypothetical protein